MDRASGMLHRNASWDIPTRPLARSKEGIWLNLSAQPFWRLMVGILLFGLIVAVCVSTISESGLMRELPLTLHSSLKADYSSGPFMAALQPFEMNLVNDALGDQAGENGNGPVVQLATVINDLQTPVPSITPFGTPVPKRTPTPERPGLPTATVPQATETTVPQPTETSTLDEPTATSAPEETATQAPSPTRRSTLPPRPTATPAEAHPTSKPTLPPAATAVPTQAPLPTATSITPPTRTPTLLPPPPTRPPASPTTPPYPPPAPTKTPAPYP